MLLAIHPQHPQPRLIQQVCVHLRKGGVIAYPTDTTYGLGCDIFEKRGVPTIYQVKQRDERKPFSFIARASSRSSTMLSRTAACPPIRW